MGPTSFFRAYYGAPSALDPKGREVGATRGLLRSFVSLLRQDDVTHVACAFDHEIESFRNDLFDGYKTEKGSSQSSSSSSRSPSEPRTRSGWSCGRW